MLELLQKGQRCTGGALLTSCMLLLLLYDDLYWSMFSLQLLLATREGEEVRTLWLGDSKRLGRKEGWRMIQQMCGRIAGTAEKE